MFELTLLPSGTIGQMAAMAKDKTPAPVRRTPLDLPTDPVQCIHVEATIEDSGFISVKDRCGRTSIKAQNGFHCWNHQIPALKGKRMFKPFSEINREQVEDIIERETTALKDAKVIRLSGLRVLDLPLDSPLRRELRPEFILPDDEIEGLELNTWGDTFRDELD